MSAPLIAVLALLAGMPLALLRYVRLGRPGEPPPLSAPREAAVYAVALAILLLAAQADGLPASLGVLGLAFALMGMGAGMRGLYRFLYGTPFLRDHPGVVRRDTARWQRLALVGSVACLVAGLVLALVGTDVAGGH